MSTTRNQVVEAAKKYIKEAKYNRPNIFTEWYFGNKTCCAWCGIFVAYIIKQVCSDDKLLAGCSNPAYIPTIYNWAKSRGYLKSTGKEGDLVIFDWSVGNGVLDRDHVGFFVKDNGNGTITTIEGNTSNQSNGNGDCVQLRIRDKKWVCAYVRLPYNETIALPAKNSYDGKLPENASTAANIKLIQKFLIWFTGDTITIDGIIGEQTTELINEFQSNNKLTITGKIDVNTLKCMIQYVKCEVKKVKYTGILPSTTISSTCGLKSQIKLWQKFLNWYYNDNLKIDGIFGTMTTKRTKDFQRENKLTVDGIVGAKTLQKAKDIEK